jgi:hypothetical protein
MSVNQYNPAPEPSLWHITKVEDAFGATSLGGSNRMKRVYYQMMNGDTSYIDVSYEPGWDQRVAALIEQAVMEHINVLMLKSVQPG